MPRGIKLTEEERHERALQAGKMHLERDETTRTVCGLEKAGGLGWVAPESEFDDRPDWRCKRCERIWLRDQEELMEEAREQSASVQ